MVCVDLVVYRTLFGKIDALLVYMGEGWNLPSIVVFERFFFQRSPVLSIKTFFELAITRKLIFSHSPWKILQLKVFRLQDTNDPDK